MGSEFLAVARLRVWCSACRCAGARLGVVPGARSGVRPGVRPVVVPGARPGIVPGIMSGVVHLDYEGGALGDDVLKVLYNGVCFQRFWFYRS